MIKKQQVTKTLISSFFLVIAQASMAMETKVFAISDFIPTTSNGCGGNDVSHWDNMVDEWYDQMGLEGHTKDGQFTNGTMTIERFCDGDWMSGCDDSIFIDDADAAMIATHGSDVGDHWQGRMRRRWNGHCGLDAGGNSNDMWVGDEDLEFIHLSSSHSTDDDNVHGIRHAMYDPNDSPINNQRAHQWDGFHGVMWIGSGFDNDYEDFADDAHSIRMSDAWVNNMYRGNIDCDWGDPFNWFGSCQEQCPVAYAVSATDSSALYRILNERYNNVLTDPTSVQFDAFGASWQCDPVGEGAYNP